MEKSKRRGEAAKVPHPQAGDEDYLEGYKDGYIDGCEQGTIDTVRFLRGI